MKILFTGASSFTGFWFVKTLAAAGHEVICPLRGEIEKYEGVRKRRAEGLQGLCRFVPSASFGSEVFLKLAGAEKCDALCHHAAEIANYKSPDFDAVAALASNTHNLRAVLKTMKCPVVLTGSVFENDEGSDGLQPTPHGEGLRAFSPYGLSKGMTYQHFRHYCHEAGVPLGKFVIPNPFGPFEEPRFTAHLMKHWREGKVAEVKTPDYLRDNIHVDLLAAVYGQFVERISKQKSGNVKINPSGYAEKQGQFAQRVAREVKSRSGWPCELKLAKQEDFSEPMNRVNTEPAIEALLKWDEKRAWDAFVEFYRSDGK
jgi:nucleoside-diphosphate-sugar epimerase